MSQESIDSKVLSDTKFNTTCDLLAILQEIQNKDEQAAKDSTDYDTIHNQSIIERILNVLDVSIEKMKYSLIIPQLLENPTELENYFTNSDIQKIFKYSDAYCENLNIIWKDDNRELINLSKVFEMFYTNKKIRENLPNYLNNISPKNKEILVAMEDNRKIAEKRLRRSAVTEIATERLIHHIYHYNEKLKKQIKDQKEEVNRKEIKTKWNVISKQGVIKKYQEDLAFKKWENSIKVKKIVVRANEEMEILTAEQDHERQQCLNELNELQKIHDDLLNKNINQNIKFRNEKNSYIDKLQILLKKYDTDILLKITEHEELVAQKIAEQKKFDEFMIEFNEQEENYKTLYNKMLEEKHRAQREKMLMFMMNRAARTIQRYWRQFVKARKKKRGKSKGKGRGKKK